MSSVRVAPLLLVCWLAVSFAAADTDIPRLTIQVQGDTVEYDGDLGTVAITGHVRIAARSDQPGYPTVSVAADGLEGDLRGGNIIVHGEVKLLSQQFAFRGDEARLNFKSDQYVLRNGAASVEAPAAGFPGQVVRGFLFGDEVIRQGEIVYVIQGRMTTCDRAHPHYSIGAQKLTYNTTTKMLRIDRGDIQLYGLKLATPGSLSLSLARSNAALIVPFPGFSSYDGVYFPLTKVFTDDEATWEAGAWLRVGTALRLPGGAYVRHEEREESFYAVVSRREQETWDINRRSRVNRLPEVTYVRHLQPVDDRLSKLDVGVFAGYLEEHAEGMPASYGTRGGVMLRYSPRPLQRHERRGWWWAAEADHILYGSGDHLTDVRLEAGAGWQFDYDASLALWGVHHITDGQSPFLFDDVYARNEIFMEAQAPLGRQHAVEFMGRWDVDRGELRDYLVGVSRREHCLTWHLRYSFARESISLGLDINGLTGRTRPPKTQPVVLPDEVPPLPDIVAIPPEGLASPVEPASAPAVTPAPPAAAQP